MGKTDVLDPSCDTTWTMKRMKELLKDVDLLTDETFKIIYQWNDNDFDDAIKHIDKAAIDGNVDLDASIFDRIAREKRVKVDAYIHNTHQSLFQRRQQLDADAQPVWYYPELFIDGRGMTTNEKDLRKYGNTVGLALQEHLANKRKTRRPPPKKRNRETLPSSVHDTQEHVEKGPVAKGTRKRARLDGEEDAPVVADQPRHHNEPGSPALMNQAGLGSDEDESDHVTQATRSKIQHHESEDEEVRVSVLPSRGRTSSVSVAEGSRASPSMTIGEISPRFFPESLLRDQHEHQGSPTPSALPALSHAVTAPLPMSKSALLERNIKFVITDRAAESNAVKIVVETINAASLLNDQLLVRDWAAIIKKLKLSEEAGWRCWWYVGYTLQASSALDTFAIEAAISDIRMGGVVQKPTIIIAKQGSLVRALPPEFTESAISSLPHRSMMFWDERTRTYVNR